MSIEPEGALRLPQPDIGVYLDTNILIDLMEGLHPAWSPPPDPTKTEKQRIAAVRLLFYGYRTRNRWYLVISGEGRKELTARGSFDWTLAVFFDIDEQSDAPPSDEVDALATKWVAEGGLGLADARHVARAALHDWIELFVTNDGRLIKQVKKLQLRDGLEAVTALEAEQRLDIEPGERPPIEPAPSSSLANVERWWVPGAS